ncbi:MAG: mechanosensitive ion channel domain-containing protein [Gemmatimonadales bacterium]
MFLTVPSLSRVSRICWLALWLAPVAPALGQQPSDSLASTRSAVDTGALVLQHRTIAVFRSPLGALSPADRAAGATRRIEALSGATAESVSTHPIPEGLLITVGTQPVFSITHADVDTLGGATLESTSRRVVSQLTAALVDAGEERSIRHILSAIGFSFAATLIFLLALRLLRAGRRVVLGRLPSAQEKLSDIALAGFTLLSRENLLLFAKRFVDLVAWAAGLFFAYLWLAYVLTRFAYTRAWGEALGVYLTSTVSRLALGALGAIPGLFTLVIIFVAVRWLARMVSAFFDSVESESVEVPWVHPETANPTKRIVVALLWLFAVVVAYPYVPGGGSDVFKGVTVFAGLVLSLGSSGVMNQAMSGLVLMYARALKPGDYVRVGETEGTVMELGLLSTKIMTTKREEVTLPNAVVVGTSVKNFSRRRDATALLLYTSVTIGYNTPWRQVEALLIDAARRTDGLEHNPPPFVLKTALSDFYIEYQLNAILEKPPERIRVLDRLHANILDSFNEFGVQITSPHYIADPSQPAVVPRDKWFQAPAATEGGSEGDP